VRIVDALWAAWDGRGLEHLRLGTGAEGVRADGLLLAVDDAGRPFRARYVVECDVGWRVRRARIERLDEPPATLDLRADGRGHWTDAATGAALPLEGCVDVDIYPSPFTNTLPIRRLADAAIGQPVPIVVAWVVLPALSVQATRQEYTLLARGADGARWRFHAPDSGFTAELPVDGDGLVRDYPGIARRL
jgi:hypothetical protein